MPRKKTPSKAALPVRRSPPGPEPAVDVADFDPGPTRPDSLPYHVVGIGASAGGLEAVSRMLKALPSDTGMAFVLVQHLAPTRASLLSEILGRASSLPVTTVEDGMAVQPNHVYVIPPGASMELSGSRLMLSPRKNSDGAHRPIDIFLRSLAEAQGHKAIGVILSGTANDGTLGCEEIKAEGGITFAQDATAQQDSMPRSATAAGCVDFVLPPDEIAQEIARIARHPLVDQPPDAEMSEAVGNNIGGVLALLRTGTGVDFTHYKHNTLYRRITRRMVLHKVDDIKEYQRMVATTPAEVEALFNDILISVTSFFRDPEAFEALKDTVFPELVQDRSGLPLRIWVLGCSTGEEAYSIAMAFSEFASLAGRGIPVQIFASDLNSAGIEKARAGVYSKAIEQDVSPERLRRYFVEADGGYRITKSIRDMVVFARHNALTDPPFSHVDLVSCRNMLIYLDAVLQQRLIPILHYGLRPDGYLWLGASETIGPHRHLFELVDSTFKFYQRKAAPLQPIGFTRPPGQPAREHPPADRSREPAPSGNEAQREADRLLLLRYAPAGVLVNADFDIQTFRGDTGPYLAPAPGRASLNLLKLLRDGLVVPVRSALLKARRDGRSTKEDLIVRAAGGNRRVTIEVTPIKAATLRETSYMVVFDDAASALARAKPGTPPSKAGTALRGARAESEINRLRQELTANREYLQSVIEQQEAANEELQSANEEVQSSNEELQSINEELETSKEEIQSSSEELATVNDELNNRNLELSRSHNDLSNLIASVQMPIVMVGPDFRIRRFTPSAEKLFNLIASDVGRPIGDIQLNLDVTDLDRMLLEVMETVTPREQTTRDKRGRWYSLRLRPYRTLDNKIDGVVLTLVDIDSLKRAEETIRAIADRLAILQDQAPLGIRETDPQGRLTKVNGCFGTMAGYAPDALLGRMFTDLVYPEDRDRALELWQKVTNGAMTSYRDEQRLVQKSGEVIWVEVHGFAVRDGDGKPAVGVAFVQNISERKQAEAELRAADRSKNEFLAMLAHELRNPLAPLLNVAELLGEPGMDPARMQALRDIFERQIRNLSRMTDDLLDVSRVSQGKMRLRMEPIELRGVVLRALELFRPSIETRGIALSGDFPDHALPVQGDSVRLEQVVDNLLTNAAKHTEPGQSIWISLREAAASQEGGMVELRVRDDGAGIDPALLPTIFDPFTQGEHGLARTRGGLGIGLTLVRKLVELHGGSVEARSEGPGLGAEFVVRLPLAPQIVPAPVAAAPGPARRLRGGRPARSVLVVDDNRDGAETLAMLLRVLGLMVAVVFDGEEAIATAAEVRPDVVLLDIGLPGKDGYQVARDLRGQPATRDATIIAISGYGQEEDRRRAAEAGIDHYFTKPVDIEALSSLLAG